MRASDAMALRHSTRERCERCAALRWREECARCKRLRGCNLCLRSVRRVRSACAVSARCRSCTAQRALSVLSVACLHARMTRLHSMRTRAARACLLPHAFGCGVRGRRARSVGCNALREFYATCGWVRPVLVNSCNQLGRAEGGFVSWQRHLSAAKRRRAANRAPPPRVAGTLRRREVVVQQAKALPPNVLPPNVAVARAHVLLRRRNAGPLHPNAPAGRVPRRRRRLRAR